MRALDRKLFRDLLAMKGQFTAIALVIACGVATFVMALSTLGALRRSQAAYYTEYRFADVFASLKRAPNLVAQEIAAIPGVARLQTRVVVEVTLDVPGLNEPAVGRIISVKAGRQPDLNRLHLRRGRWLEPNRQHEVLVGEAFAEAHGIDPGDRITAVINGRLQELTIVGIVLSPEYVYQVRSGAFVPDNLRFGVFWMDEEELAAAYDMDGAFNDIAVTLSPGASVEEVIRRIDLVTERYGGLGAYSREDQVSHRFVTDEFQQLRIMAVVPPTIFLSVAAFLLNVVLSRMIATQREQIAALKAFGYTKVEVAVHYLKLVGLIVLIGLTLGSLLGTWLGADMTQRYSQFFRFPRFDYRMDAGALVPATFVSVLAGVVAAIDAVRRAAILPPAEAMRPEPPMTFRPTVIEQLGLQRFFTPTARMILRNLERRPLRAMLSISGVSLAVAVVVLGNFGEDALGFLIEHQFYTVQRYDISVGFVEPRHDRALHELQRLPGVIRAEPLRTVAVRIRHGHRTERLALQGLPPDATLQQVIDSHTGPMKLPQQGIVLSQTLAELLEVTPGSTVRVEVLQEKRPVVDVPVAATVHEYVGLSAYMDIAALNRLMGEGAVVSGALLSVDERELDNVFLTLKGMPQIGSVTVKNAAVRSFQETIAETILKMRAVNAIFATVIAFGVIYNSARISLSERSRDLASLRVLGFTRGEISVILLGELGVVVALAVPLGLVLGHWMAYGASLLLQTETTRIPFVLERSTYGLALAITMIASIVSGFVVRRRLDHLDLVAVLKVRE